ITERQKTILESLVEGYIQSARPISSQWLEKEAGFDFSPATIRSELLVLMEKGYLEQPHVSAGRIPTDRGYRFVVDDIIQEIEKREEELSQLVADPPSPSYGEASQFEFLGRLTEASSALVLGYRPGSGSVWKQGWEHLLREPEFEERDSLWNLTKFVEDVEKHIADFLPAKAMEVYIGKENPFSKVKDFAIIVRRSSFDSRQAGLVAMVGPKRMEYEKNIDLLISYGRKKDN
ncbi:MAG: hypothetical protein HY603_00925, partial [Parcubacteria group bacterium]|nr:hypothetical protein [Parcubacteria group bacterium]